MKYLIKAIKKNKSTFIDIMKSNDEEKINKEYEKLIDGIHSNGKYSTIQLFELDNGEYIKSSEFSNGMSKFDCMVGKFRLPHNLIYKK